MSYEWLKVNSQFHTHNSEFYSVCEHRKKRLKLDGVLGGEEMMGEEV